ncbi:tyrosine--tRNA ligase [Candidatus Daviesbacteria bacterium RIFOXYD1_FULL_41_10]|uniref:tyrosine--tRNA ligase n=2 Tax=Candidatus Daviesiibacteriota TaxID=1752718 RepID=A0A1F5N2F5_9BACT|nr:MAG: Tyrosine-tRNA ligase [Candidatus Daviesbacteria bacterium GW2011_GWB1_41_5]OGE71805.1 MAG: tyrosine--tRNA ligase [Candidatus Daviesbacteria bacterium RIFOXYD1_FULL_41_10]
MTNDDKFKLITRNLEEVLTREELKVLIESGTPLKHYIGFEISGKVHLGTGLLTMIIINNLQKAGVETCVLLADWHTWLNNKLDGQLHTATKLARAYFEEGLKAAALCVGADTDKIEFVLGSELYELTGLDYWSAVIKVSKATTVARMIRSTTIMGRREGEISDAAMLIYPAMQAADIFTMGITLAHAGTDQRNVHVVARDTAKEAGYPKPIALHHHLLQGLLKPPVWPIPEGNRDATIEVIKMSKSKPDSAVFIHDSPEEIRRKVGNAFCPEGETKYNPILDWAKHLIFFEDNSRLEIKRDEKFGGDIIYTSYEDLEKDYEQKKLHPQDLKNAVAEWLIKKLEPARKHFEDPKRKAALEEMESLTRK